MSRLRGAARQPTPLQGLSQGSTAHACWRQRDSNGKHILDTKTAHACFRWCCSQCQTLRPSPFSPPHPSPAWGCHALHDDARGRARRWCCNHRDHRCRLHVDRRSDGSDWESRSDWSGTSDAGCSLRRCWCRNRLGNHHWYRYRNGIWQRERHRMRHRIRHEHWHRIWDRDRDRDRDLDDHCSCRRLCRGDGKRCWELRRGWRLRRGDHSCGG
mmetsp:Transcript_12794/g.32275  ORF Transcript_12794/g.32275 Transcript_12794/m.32275 type:complete len:213 (+) Transcript_12794:47-685(+)